MSRRVRIIVEAGPQVGRGHAGRALAVGAALARRSIATVIEVVDGHLTPAELSRSAANGIGTDPVDRPAPSDVIVLDVPDPGRWSADHDPERLVVFDDRDRFAGHASIVIQPSRGRWQGTGSAAAVLAGYRFAPIDPRYAHGRRAGGAPVPPIPTMAALRLVVCFGGSDPHDVTGRVAGAVAAAVPGTDVVVGASYSGRYGSPPAVRDPVDLPTRIAGATAVLIGGGTMKFEVACLGVPAAILAVSDDQPEVAAEYAATGAAVYLGDGRDCDPERVAAEVDALIRDAARRDRMAQVASQLVDGLGADRIADALLTAFARPPSRPTA